jgi:hypothetical protein
MRIISIPATLRIMVPEGTTDEECQKLAEATQSEANATLNEKPILSEVKEHIRMFEPELSGKLVDADIWVWDKPQDAAIMDLTN